MDANSKNPSGGKTDAGTRNTAGLEGVKAKMPEGASLSTGKMGTHKTQEAAGTASTVKGEPIIPQTSSSAQATSPLGQATISLQKESAAGNRQERANSSFSTPPPSGTGGTPARDNSGNGWKPLTSFNGIGFEYFCIVIKTLLLSMVTLGIYSFWGKTRQRQYMWSHTQVLDEPLEYTGTGKELFISFLLVMPLFLLGSFLAQLLLYSVPVLGSIVFYVALLFLIQLAVYRALRYRLTRTRWRGIRGNLSGSSLEYAAKSTGYIAVTICTLGIMSPWANAKMTAMMLNNVWFGDRKMSFSGPARELFKSFAIFWCLTVGIIAAFGGVMALALFSNGLFFLDPETLIFLALVFYIAFFGCIALVSAYYQASVFRWLFGHMSFGSMRTRSTLSGMAYFKLTAANILLFIFTLGLGAAWIMVRVAKMRLGSIDYTGDPDLNTLLQDTKSAPTRGEGLLEAIDVDIAF